MLFRLLILGSLLNISSGLFFGPDRRTCSRSSQCPGFRRLTCEGRGPNVLFIIPTCGRQRPYTEPGRCEHVIDGICQIGSFLTLQGGPGKCRTGRKRCAECILDEDCNGWDQYCSGFSCFDRNRNTVN